MEAGIVTEMTPRQILDAIDRALARAAHEANARARQRVLRRGKPCDRPSPPNKWLRESFLTRWIGRWKGRRVSHRPWWPRYASCFDTAQGASAIPLCSRRRH